MPALRKSLRERDPRSQHPRSSSTPFASPTGTPSDTINDRKQRSITEWTEPQPQQLAPSFEEHGFARHGVLENMAPLGVPPKARDRQRARALGEPAPRQSFPGKGNYALGDEATSTPEVTPAPELDPDDSEKMEEEDLPLEYPIMDEDEDDDYEPNKQKKKAKVSKTPVRGKENMQSKASVNGKVPAKNGLISTTTTSASPAVQAVGLGGPADVAAQRMQIYVNDAVSRANKNDRRNVGTALKELFETSKTDSYAASVLDAIMQQNPTSEQMQYFRSNIKMLKKRIKKEGGEREVVPGFHSIIRSTRQRSQRASSEVGPDDSVSVAHDLDADNAPNMITEDSHRAQQFASDDATLNPFNTAPTLSAAATTTTVAEPARRLPSRSPRKRHSGNNRHAADSEMDVDAVASTAVPTPAAKTPDTGASDSELSEVNEEIVQKGPPELAQLNGNDTPPIGNAAPKKGKNVAAARAAKKAKNIGRWNGKHPKPQVPTPEQRAEEEALREVRKELEAQQPIRQLDNNFQLSDVRFDDEILETESLTESQIAVGPPVDSDQPRRAGRVPPRGTKRQREGVSSRVPSPQPQSAVATRPSTPVVGPMPKKLKLTNGQAAKTKRSPVKNRDVGPIAGVAFNGGGGSRQLGPDDNDPSSPQSDSDDFCAACQGPGEFVCCEKCPRVFHLLCCDPPRVEVPEDAFYCQECEVKKNGPSDATAAHTFRVLGPLFKSLESTNPRAFSLPRDVQNSFEGISARTDGSFAEDTKKIPLSKNSGYGYQRPDYTKVLEGDKPILCVQCGLSSGNKRQMLKCDFCHAHWHLDCVDPPLANPPHISLEASQRDAWRCPRHIEHDLRSGLVAQQDLNENIDVEMFDAPPVGRVTRKIRKRKDAETIEPTFSRGMRNNGLIDIINDSDDETDGEGNYVFGVDESKDLNSKVFRVPEKGLILDFVSKVKSGRVAKQKATEQARKAATSQRQSSMQHFLAHPIQQQQAALGLAQLARQEPNVGLGEGKVAALILSLTAEASSEVVSAMDKAAPPALTDVERAELLKLEELIKLRLRA